LLASKPRKMASIERPWLHFVQAKNEVWLLSRYLRDL
jgi:hypothetical protein